jgi:hypothetical protein
MTTQTAPQRVAILLYGYLRTIDVTAASLIKHVAAPLNADIFYFGPSETDKPGLQHKGVLDCFGAIKDNPKNDAETDKGKVDLSQLERAYGDRLKAYKLHTEAQETFRNISKEAKPHEWLYALDPTRLFSMAYNMAGVYRLLSTYEEESGQSYDVVLLTRPDLAFFRPLLMDVENKEVHIPDGQGFDPFTGQKLFGNAPVMFYKNIETGEAMEAGKNFNDQVIALHRKDAHLIGSLFDAFRSYLSLRIPLTPESMIYFHLCTRGGLKLVKNPDWLYEIVRFGQKAITNVTDLPVLECFDPHHPLVKERNARRPLWTILKKTKKFCRYIFRRIFS